MMKAKVSITEKTRTILADRHVGRGFLPTADIYAKYKKLVESPPDVRRKK